MNISPRGLSRKVKRHRTRPITHVYILLFLFIIISTILFLFISFTCITYKFLLFSYSGKYNIIDIVCIRGTKFSTEKRKFGIVIKGKGWNRKEKENGAWLFPVTVMRCFRYTRWFFCWYIKNHWFPILPQY